MILSRPKRHLPLPRLSRWHYSLRRRVHELMCRVQLVSCNREISLLTDPKRLRLVTTAIAWLPALCVEAFLKKRPVNKGRQHWIKHYGDNAAMSFESWLFRHYSRPFPWLSQINLNDICRQVSGTIHGHISPAFHPPSNSFSQNITTSSCQSRSMTQLMFGQGNPFLL